MASSVEGRGGGGTFCEFQVGTSGASAARVRYISRESAVKEREQGILLYGLPARIHELASVTPGKDSGGDGRYALLRWSLVAHAWAREALEPHLRSQKRVWRTHYRATLSFERDIETAKVWRLVKTWLVECFPKGQAMAFLHRNTSHPHVHIWLDARGQDGRKLNFSARAFRQIDERWNALYAPAFGHPEQEHLLRKRDGARERAGRKVRGQWKEWEQRNAGQDELEKSRTGGGEPDASRSVARDDRRKPEAFRGEQALTRSVRERVHTTRESTQTDRAAENAVSETDRLRETLTRLGEQEREREVDRDFGKTKEQGLER